MKYLLKLYITGQTDTSSHALNNIESFCKKHLKGDYELEVVDILKEPQQAEEDKIIAVPTLIKVLPQPVRKFVGDFSDTEKMLTELNLSDKSS